MCYSAQVVADYKHYVQLFGAVIDIKTFYNTFWRRSQDAKVRIPKAMEDAFLDAQSGTEREIRELIEAWRIEQAIQFEQELFKQKKRLADAERTLLTKVTKTATESRRIATDKMAWAMGKLADLRRSEPLERDRRIFPGWYAPVMVWEDGRRVVKPMRYQCRPAGKPAFYDVKFPGTYNARRDNLEGFWRPQFGRTHGVMVVNAFYENVRKRLAQEPKVLTLPPPIVETFDNNAAGPVAVIRPFCAPADYGDVFFLTNKIVVEEIAKAGFAAPNPGALLK